MLGTRTKQVNSYGKRAQRVISTSDEPRPRKEIPNIFDEPEAPIHWAPIASKMRKRENVGTSSTTSGSSSPRIIHVQRRKTLRSPIRKKKVAALVDTRERPLPRHSPERHDSTPQKCKEKKTACSSDHVEKRSRPPLATHSVNIPSSPAVVNRKSKHVTSKVQKKLHKPVLDAVDVDIILLDEDGTTIAKERRVSHPKLGIDPTRRNVQYKVQKLPLYSLSDSEDDLAVGSPQKGSKGKATIRRIQRDIPLAQLPDSPAFLDIEAAQHQRTQPSRYHFTPPGQDTRSSVKQKLPLYSLSDSEDDLAVGSPQKGSKGKATIRRNQRDIPLAQLPDSPAFLDIEAAQHQRTQPSRYHFTPRGQDTRSSVKQSKPTTSYAQLLQHPTRLPTSSLQSSDRYTHISSPIIRPRQLTPIRGLRTTRNVAPPSPPTPTDFDSSIDLSDLYLESSGLSDASRYVCDPVVPEYLKPLLQECHQEECGLYDFSSFITSFPYDPIIRSSLVDDNMEYGFKKIGEASYSEVFGIGDVVLKIIPLRKETSRQSGVNSIGHEPEDPATSDAKDVRKEIIVTRAMGEVCDGFVKLLKAYVVRGRYPDMLLQLWDEYNETRGSESIRPDTFTASQIYAIIVLPNGGPDLEAYTFTSAGKSGWRQACSIFWQVSKALAHAEQLASFEHRDLHWGQILVKDLSADYLSELKNLSKTLNVVFMDDPAHGVQATIIDLGLSRMDASDSNGLERVYWTPLDEEVFMGEGDYQFDVYRLMKQHATSHWASFNPLTNVMWLHYLALKLLQSKRLRPPAIRYSHATTTFTEKDCYKCLLEIEGLLATCIRSVRQSRKAQKGQGRRKTSAPTRLLPISSSFSCAADVIRYGVEKGWICL